ncbi:MAG TPA: HupE/UreJ family protein, partial [Leptospiraceae bacterium]|nr:HupE/UreJ family protein [Leptospiraceae bacterium]
FHGAAHASEGPAAISYAIGFLASTAALHVAGLLLGNIQTRAGSVLSRAVGAAMIALAMAG